MSDQTQSTDVESEIDTEAEVPTKRSHKLRSVAIKSLILLLTFVVGGFSGYTVGHRLVQEQTSSSESDQQASMAAMMEQVNPTKGYEISANFGDVGSQLVAAGAIDMAKFTSLYQQQNQPLTSLQMDILTKDTASKIVITPQNAYFLLNFFWALGLTNENKILTEGEMTSGGKSKVGGFASTGGWTLGTKAANDLFASTKIMPMTDEQQARLEEVTVGVYRPCCNNPTHFPDCNHGMAMLDLLELMASQNASTDEMYKAAKYANAFWYPQQTLEVATLFKFMQKVDFVDADAKTLVSRQYSSGSGFQAVHQYLSQNGLLEQAPSSGGSCGVR